MDEHIWTTTSRISVSGPSGWAPVEQLEVPHASGRAVVRVERYRVPPDADIDSLAAQHGVRIAVEGGTDSGTEPHEVLGSADGRRRTVTWSDEDGRLQAVVDYALDRGRLVVVTTVTPVDDPTLAGAAAGVVASIRVSEPVHMPEDQLPLRPGRVDLSEVARAWREGTRPEPREEHVITTEESFGAAKHFGVAMLPGADTSLWDQLDMAQRDLAAAVAWRSLEARGAADGTDLGEALELAASHDLIVMVTGRRGEESSTQWFAARPDRMVRLRPSGAGRITLTTHPTADLADLVLASTAQDAEVSASAVYRADGHVVGDETSWHGDDAPEGVREALGRLVTQTHVGGAP
ncbi:hypothetical protein [Nocardioides ganghwensis]|uniref:Uncharacterized protein n=1 Tax=Nocardioides ganghwensis TaxID=252230 RepID=A0A4Q2S8C5_9ACTN|nr:hypothetical protein [Nocardioides ganghwensis]MBD3945614.1 hypothetical protein [Nocardioides ganghwensis]RYB99647.1 hypothetical protein EUA07_15995 [Nocardioides ganghwensis]